MRESIKTILVLIIIVCSIVIASMLFLPQGPGPARDRWFILSAAAIIGGPALVLFLRMHFTRDLVPNYLSQHAREFFDRDGLCFAPTIEQSQGLCYLTVYFKSRYERPSQAHIRIRPRKGLLGRAKIDPVEVHIPCGPAAFGIARILWAIPAKYQGKKHEFEVGATVHYPGGKGKMVRFRDGKVIRTSAKFRNVAHTGLSIAGLLTGSFVLFSPASITIPLPFDVAEERPDDASAEIETLWDLDQVDVAI